MLLEQRFLVAIAGVWIDRSVADIRTHTASVLVIGTGAAGLRAAIAADRGEQKSWWSASARASM